MGELIAFRREEEMKRGILASIWWAWVISTRGRYHDLWAGRFHAEAHKVCYFHS